MAKQTKKQRLDLANEFIQLIATSGRQFFNYADRPGKTISYLELRNNQVYFIDGFTYQSINTSNQRHFRRYFSEGGTIQSLIQDLALFIHTGEPTNGKHGYGGVYCSHWGYPGKDMHTIHQKAVDIGFSKGSITDYRNHRYITNE